MNCNNRALSAIACIHGDSAHPNLRGKVRFVPHGKGTMVTAEICGLPQSETGFFALHIHEGGDCCGEGFSGTGGHYNPTNANHPCHAGDLPPLLGCNGRATLSVATERFRVQDVIGRTVVIHSHPDDFKTQPSGGAGEKIACGVICRA